jgi:EAL domain-containing protein (putative c-di-GMP-specific phosphodiesterase class I)
VLRQACRDATAWPESVRLAVNVSPLQIRTRALAADVRCALESAGLSPHRLELEVTEGVLMSDTDITMAVLRELRDIGVRMALDDFGTGYSSLSCLHKFDFDKVKIDRSFVSEIGKTHDSLPLIRAITSMCDSLGITTVAEGVETEMQATALRNEGCTQLQGFLFGKPTTLETALRMIPAPLTGRRSGCRPGAGTRWASCP